MPRIRGRLPARGRRDHRGRDWPPGRRHPGRRGRWRGRRGRHAIRPVAGQGHRARAGPRDGARAARTTRSPRPASWASPPTAASCAGCSRSRMSRAARRRPSCIDRDWQPDAGDRLPHDWPGGGRLAARSCTPRRQAGRLGFRLNAAHARVEIDDEQERRTSPSSPTRQTEPSCADRRRRRHRLRRPGDRRSPCLPRRPSEAAVRHARSHAAPDRRRRQGARCRARCSTFACGRATRSGPARCCWCSRR